MRESRTSGLMSGIWKRKKRSDIQTPTNRKGRKQLRLNLTPPRQISTLPALRVRGTDLPGLRRRGRAGRRGPFRGLHRSQLGLELLVLVEDLEEDFRQPPAGGDVGLVMLTGHDAVD